MAYSEEKAFELVKSAHERGRLGHAFLISAEQINAPKRLVTRIIQMLNESEDDSSGGDLFGESPKNQEVALEDLEGEYVRVVRPQSKARRIPIDAIREVEKSLYHSSQKGVWKVAVILEADRMGVEAENAFLKTLEEPPSACLLLLVTQNPQKLLPTILSRCVRLSLISDVEQRLRSEAEMELLKALVKFSSHGFGSLVNALSLKGAFGSLLQQEKRRISKLYEGLQKEEVTLYKQTTEGDYLKQREEHFKALIESEYLAIRSQMIDVLVTWMGDLVRVKSGLDRLDFPQQQDSMKTLVEKSSLENLFERMEALESLRGTLETNASEQLALEVGFMKAFS